jgi:probable HAF family extracellular repeat protein
VVGLSTGEDTSSTRAVLFDGVFHHLGTLGGSYSEAAAINDHGQVVGASETVERVFHHAFLYENGMMRDLGTLGGIDSYAFDVNNHGQVVGQALTTGNAATRAFLYDGTMRDLGTFGGNGSSASAINDHGHIVGFAQTAQLAFRAFLHDGVMHDLGTLGGAESYAYDIYASGYVVGTSNVPGNAVNHAFLYTSSGGMVDLNSLIDPTLGYVLQEAKAINDAGQIAANARVGNQIRAVLLTPVPEPPIAAMAGAAITAAWGIRRRAFGKWPRQALRIAPPCNSRA